VITRSSSLIKRYIYKTLKTNIIMKKRDTIVLIIVLIIIAIGLYFLIPKFTGNVVSQSNCIDSDGKDYYTKGNVEQGPTINGIDYCYNKEQLKEYYCEEDTLKVEVYNCPDGCVDGACKQMQTEPEQIELPENKMPSWIWIVLGLIIAVTFLIIYKKKK